MIFKVLFQLKPSYDSMIWKLQDCYSTEKIKTCQLLRFLRVLKNELLFLGRIWCFAFKQGNLLFHKQRFWWSRGCILSLLVKSNWLISTWHLFYLLNMFIWLERNDNSDTIALWLKSSMSLLFVKFLFCFPSAHSIEKVCEANFWKYFSSNISTS